MKSITTNLSGGLVLAALAMAATTHATAQEYTFTTLAGPPEAGPGAIDGPGTAARFNWPCGVAVDSAGNVYVADTWNQTIRKVTPGGVVTTLAGNASIVDRNGMPIGGYADGTGSAARFNNPSGLAVDGAGNIYVADTWNCTIRKVTPGGVVTTLAGMAGSYGSADGTGSAAQFRDPYGVAVDSAGNIYVADTSNHAIRKVTPGGVVTTLAGLAGGWGSADGAGSAARFNGPYGVAVDNAGNVYVADSNNQTIRKVRPSGVVTTLAGNAAIVDKSGDPAGGYADGTGSAARFFCPQAVAVDSAGNLYVADTDNDTIRKVTPGGVVTTLAGAWTSGSADGTGTAALFDCPGGVAVDSAGNVYVADTRNHTIRKVTPGGLVTTLAGLAGSSGCADGTGSAARFNWPWGVAVDSAGNVYVADSENYTIRKVTPGGVVTTLAGLAGSWGTNDGVGSAAQFSFPCGVAVDSAGNVYVADTQNSTIRKVTPGGVVTTLAGPGASALAVDSGGNLYLAFGNSIQEATPVGTNSVVTTLAGLAGSSGTNDGTGSAARFSWPWGVAVDSAGNVYVADGGNSTIRKVTPGGVVTTLAGLAGSSGTNDGTGSAARFAWPCGVAVDSAGNVYVADTMNSTIRRVTAGGVVTTLAGLAGSDGSADGTGGEARFALQRGMGPMGPEGLAVDSAGNVYVADTYNNTIRIGGVACPDAPTIDVAVGPLGQLRQLDTSPQTAVAWQWRLIRDPSASSAALSAANVRNPTFTPDVADLYVFRLEATNAAGAICIRTLSFTAYAPPGPPPVLLTDGSFGVRSNRFGFNVSAAAGQVVVVETSPDLVHWTGLATNTAGASPFFFSDPAPPNLRCRFYRARAQ